jgi:hypothetical protein
MFKQIWHKLTKKKELNMSQTESKSVSTLRERLNKQIKETAYLKGRVAEVSERLDVVTKDLSLFKKAVTRDVKKIADDI